MAGTSSQPEFSFDDFRRYYDGDMSAQEQHNLEERMLEEPLVAEAYEGFLALIEDQVNYQSALGHLRETLNDRTEPKRDRTLPLWVYASAASVIFALGLYWLVFALNRSTGNESVAFEMSIEKPAEVTAETPKLEKAPSPPATLEPSPQKAMGNTPKVAAKAKPAETIELPQEERKQLEINLEDAVAAYDQEQISVVETIPAAVPAVALSARTPSRNSAAKVSQNYAADAGANVTSTRPTPLIGWVSYQSYLFKNAGSAEKPGTVDVTFMVNADSTLSEFSARGDTFLFQKAIQTIQYGPVWIPAKSSGHQIGIPATVRIRFYNSN